MADGGDFSETARAAPILSTRPTRMPDKPLEMTLHNLCGRVLGRSDFGVDARLDELAGRSQVATLLAAAEDILRRPIPDGAWSKQPTIRNLTKAICEEARKDLKLATCARDGQGRPFFFCHGDFSTNGFYALTLTTRLGGDRPVHLLHPDFKPDGTFTAEQVAKPYVDEIERLQPTGPIDLGGYCNGGLVAWEIAHQLVARGRKLNRLILLDTTSLNARLTLRSAARLAGNRRMEVMSGLWLNSVQRNLTWRKRHERMLAIITGKLVEALPPATSRLARVEASALRTLAPYILPSLPVHVDFIVSAESAAYIELQAGPMRRLAPSLTRHVVPGDHLTCITTHVDALAAVLTGLLEARSRCWRFWRRTAPV